MLTFRSEYHTIWHDLNFNTKLLGNLKTFTKIGQGAFAPLVDRVDYCNAV